MVLIMLLFLIGLAGTGYILYGLNGTSAKIERDKRTTAALEEAKAAIVAWSLVQTTPGKLPCPEDTAAIGTPNEGQALGSCSNSAVSVGRLAWKTLGLGDIRDGNGDKLWYVLSPGFRNSPINTSTTPTITADGISAAAIVFSSGPPLDGQSRDNNAPSVDEYLESPNNGGTTTNFISTPQSITFNDRLLAIKIDDFMPNVEQVALKTAKDALNNYYQSYSYFPFAASLGSTTNPNQCVQGNLSGLLPTSASPSQLTCTCTSNTVDRRCSCSWSAVAAVSYIKTGSTNYFGTTGFYAPTAPCQVTTTNVANDTCYCTGGGGNCKRSTSTTPRFSCNTSGLCTFSSTSINGYFKLTSSQTLSLPTPNPSNNKCSPSGNTATCTFSANGQSGSFVTAGCSDPEITSNPVTNNLPSWFTANNWQNEIYYVVSDSCTSATANPTSCQTANQATHLTVGSSDARALLVSPGQRITNTPYAAAKAASQNARPSTDIKDYLDSTENTNGDTTFDAVNTHRTSNYNDHMSIVAP